MYTNRTVQRRARPLACVAVVAGALCAGAVAAKDDNVTIALHVTADGLDLSRPAEAQRFYARLQNAAWVVCTHGNRVNLVPLDDVKGCYEKSLGNAIRSANLPLLTNMYLATHTPQQAEACGIHIRLQAALE
jgi:UrcA family protein